MNAADVDPKPIYRTPKPNRAVRLCRLSKAQLMVDGELYAGRARASVELLPKPRLLFRGTFPGAPLNTAEGPLQIRLPSAGFSSDVVATSLTWPKVDVVLTAVGGPAVTGSPDSKAISRAVFHLVNFSNVQGTGLIVEPKPGRSIRLDRSTLKADGWRCVLRNLTSTSTLLSPLRDEGGYAITHVGCLEREDGRAFTGVETNEWMELLHYFLSFARGFWVSPALPVGFADSGRRVWQQWQIPLSDPWHYAKSWFAGTQSGAILAETFPGFCNLWRNPLWHKPLKELVYWYLASNTASRGTDTGIILTQTAMELLAWIYLVKDKKLMSKRQFKRRPAAKRLTALLESLGIPTSIPGCLSELTNTAHRENWEDAPHALTAVRNNIVHPDRKVDTTLSALLWDAWDLGLWYLELTILRLLGHSGKYGNRLAQKFVCESEPVPWAP